MFVESFEKLNIKVTPCFSGEYNMDKDQLGEIVRKFANYHHVELIGNLHISQIVKILEIIEGAKESPKIANFKK